MKTQPYNSESGQHPRDDTDDDEVNNARFRQFPVGQILRNFNTTTSIGEAVQTFGGEL